VERSNEGSGDRQIATKKNRMDKREEKEDTVGNAMSGATLLVPCRYFAYSSYSVCPSLPRSGAFYGGSLSEKVSEWLAQSILRCGQAIGERARIKEDSKIEQTKVSEVRGSRGWDLPWFLLLER
jgi:hypothetical protein